MLNARFLSRSHALRVVLILLATSALGDGIAKSGSLTQVTTMKNTLASRTDTVKVFWEADRMRIERYGVQGMIVELQIGQILYIYNPKENKAIKSSLGKTISVQKRLQAMAAPAKGGKKVGSATLCSLKCDVFSVSNSKGSAKWYQSIDSRFPLKLKTLITVGTASELTEVRDLKLNYNVSDRLFQLPKGVEVTEAKKPTGGTRK